MTIAKVDRTSSMTELCDEMDRIYAAKYDITNAYARAAKLDEAYQELEKQEKAVQHLIALKVPR